jgi:cysteine desulfurase
MVLFLDSNSHVQLTTKALNAYAEYNKSIYGTSNPMSNSGLGRLSASKIEESRSKIAKLLGVNSNQIYFTSSGTQACEWGLKILKSRNFSKVFYSTVEHKSISSNIIEMFGSNDLYTSKDGVVACTINQGPNTAYICIHAHNEIGTIQKIENIPVPFFTDISQSVGKIPLNLSLLKNLKIAAFGGHKFGGSSSVGILYIQDHSWWKELDSNNRYNFDRAGTPDTGAIIATATALEEAVISIPKRYENALVFRSVIESGLKELGFNIIGENSNRIPYTTFAYIGNKRGAFLMEHLESCGIYIGLGSACNSLTKKASETMMALGNGGNISDYVRISQWGNYGEVEAKQVINTIKKYCARS